MSTRVRLSFLILVLTPSVAFAEAAPVSTPAEATQLNSWIQQGITQTLEGDRDQADATWKDLRAAAPTHPAGWVYQVDTLYWRQIYDEGDPRLDVEITEHAEHAVRLAEARIEKDAKDADAHYYLGQAFIQLGRLDGVRGELLSAGSLGEKGRGHLEQALEFDPDLLDARYPLGLYYYYADLATRWFKWLQFLWFVPTGNAPMGLRYIQETTEGDSHHRHDAQFILADISLEDEPQRTDLATELMDRMHARFPDNTLIHHRLIDTRFESGRYEDVLTEASKLAASTGGDSLDTLLRSTAPIWRARAFVQLGLPDRARAELSGFPEGGPDRPHWAGAWVRLTNAQILDMAGERDEALSSYRDVSGLAQPHAVRRAQLLADAGIEAPFVTARVASSLAAQAR